jgi:hypothetical protein
LRAGRRWETKPPAGRLPILSLVKYKER